MASIHPFKGTVLSSTLCELGEGISFEAETDTLWWCNILGKALHAVDMASGKETIHPVLFRRDQPQLKFHGLQVQGQKLHLRKRVVMFTQSFLTLMP